MRVICVTGTPACGKSRLSKPLARLLGYRYIELTPLIKKYCLYDSYDRRLQTYVVDVGKLKRFVESFLKKNSEWKGAIVDGHLSHELPPDLVDRVVVVRCNPKVLHRRLLLRRYSAEKVQENMDAEIIGVCEEEARANGHRLAVVDGSSFDEKSFKSMLRKILTRKEYNRYVRHHCV